MTKKTLETTLTAEADNEVVRFEFTILNDTEESVELRFTSGFEADMAVISGDNEVWRWSDGRFFTQALQTLQLKPGESKTYERKWTGSVPGEYTAVATLEDRFRSARASTSFTVPEEGKRQEQHELDASLTARKGRNGIELDFTVINNADREVELVFPDLQTAEFTAFDGGEQIWRTRSVIFRQPPQPDQEIITLSPDGETTFQATWFDPDPGTYTVTAALLAQSTAADTATRVTIDNAGRSSLTGELTAKVSDAVSFEYIVTNNGGEPIKSTFANRPVFRLRVFDGDEVVWHYPAGLLPEVKNETYAPEESVKYTVETNLSPGNYTAISVLETSGGIAGATTEFTVSSALDN